MIEHITRIFDRVRHEFGANEVFSSRRAANIDPFTEGDMRLAKPTRILYRMKFLPDFAQTSAEIKMLAHGWGFGPVPQIPGGIMAYSEEMCSHVVPMGKFDYLEARIKLSQFNHGLQLTDIFNLDDLTDPMLARLAMREKRDGPVSEYPDRGRILPPQILDCK